VTAIRSGSVPRRFPCKIITVYPQTDDGDVHVEQGDLPAALESYRASLAIAERLAQADPGNAGGQRDLVV
jgi:hypothetical protein